MEISTQNVFRIVENNQPVIKREIKTKPMENDSFVSQNSDASNDGKFTAKEAIKNFGKGILSPLKAMAKHPFITLGTVVGAAVLGSMVPVLGPVLAIGFGAAAVFELGKGCFDAIKNYSSGNYDEAEKSFQKIGSGTFGVATTAIGMKASAKVVAEAKLLKQTGGTVLDAAQRAEVASTIKSGGWVSALKENISLLTSKEGLQAFVHQFKPTQLKARAVDLKNFVTLKKVDKEVAVKTKEKYDIRLREFQKSEEGIRRAALTDEQVQQEAMSLFDNVFDELGIDKSIRPKLKIEKAGAEKGGFYNPSRHEISFNPESYKSGHFEIDDVLMHEATHCKEAILRASLPKETVEQIVKESMLQKIKTGETEKILKSGGFLGPQMMDPPKMSPNMRESFAQFADDFLYGKDDLSTDLAHFSSPGDDGVRVSQKLEPVIDKLKNIVNDNPDFVAQFDGDTEKALGVLVDYSLSHNVRYGAFCQNSLGGLPGASLPKLTPEQTQQAILSLKNHMPSLEGNAGVGGFNLFGHSKGAFNQYQFSPEEVLAQREGNNFLIKNLTSKLEELKVNGSLTPEKEAYLTKTIDRAKQIIEYKNKGLEYYESYTELINNPGNEKLKASVEAMEVLLENMEKAINPMGMEEVSMMIKMTGLQTLPHRINILNVLGMEGTVLNNTNS